MSQYNKSSALAVLSVVSSLFALYGAAEDQWHGGNTKVVINVTEGETETIGTVNLLDNATIEKSGKGTLVVPLANILQTKPFIMKVKEGRVKVERGLSPVEHAPMEILNKAALWVDAGLSEFGGVTNGSGSLTWYDVRETSFENPARIRLKGAYIGNASLGMSEQYPSVVDGVDGIKGVDCNGFGSGSVLLKEGFAGSLNCYDVFTVYRLTRAKYGFMYYTEGHDNNLTYHPASASITVGGSESMLRTDSAAMHDARWWYDGVEIDAFKTTTKAGLHVFGNHFRGLWATISGLGYFTPQNDAGSLPDRNGWDQYLAVVLFTNKLTLAEHVKVERYLNSRYGQEIQATKSYTFDACNGAEVILDGVSESEVVVHDDRATPDNNGIVHYSDSLFDEKLIPGVSSCYLQQDAVLDLTAGKRVTSDSADPGVRLEETGGTPERLNKTGLQSARLASVPADVRKLTVEAGLLKLSPQVVNIGESNVVVDVPNENFQTGGTGLKSGTVGGWTINTWPLTLTSGVVWNDSYVNFVTHNAGDTTWFYYNGLDKNADWLRGTGYCSMRGASAITANIEIPESGIYELTVKFSKGGYNSRVDVFWGADADNLDCAGCFFDIDKARTASNANYLPWQVRTIRLVCPTSGTYLLRFRNATYPGTTGDQKSAFSMLTHPTIMRIGSLETGCDYPIPGGDFEQLQTNLSFATATENYNRAFSGDYKLDDWTVVGGSNEGVGPVLRGSDVQEYTASAINYSYYSAKLDRGDNSQVQLLLANLDGYAEKTLKLPGGCWMLRADAMKFQKSNKLGQTLRPGYVNAGAAVRATLTIGGVETVLGEPSILDYNTHFAHTWNVPFTIPSSGAEAKIRFQLISANAGMVLDNLRLVPVGNNGKIMLSSDYSIDAHLRVAGTPTERTWAGIATVGPDAAEYTEVDCRYNGSDSASGSIYYIVDCASIYRTQSFSKPGRYRLVYHTRGRSNGKKSSAQKNYMGNRLECYFAAGGRTNALDVALVDSTNWVQHVTTFDVRSAGTYSIGFRGLNFPTQRKDTTSPDDGGWDKRAFVDGISVAYVNPQSEAVFTVPQNLDLIVKKGSRVNLAFPGTNEVGFVRLDGHRVSGIVNADAYPEYFLGTGTLKATGTPPGLTITVR